MNDQFLFLQDGHRSDSLVVSAHAWEWGEPGASCCQGLAWRLWPSRLPSLGFGRSAGQRWDICSSSFRSFSGPLEGGHASWPSGPWGQQFLWDRLEAVSRAVTSAHGQQLQRQLLTRARRPRAGCAVPLHPFACSDYFQMLL